MREDGQAVDDALYSLAMGPDTRVRHYESCVVGDVRYNTLARDEGRKTQNSAIMSTDTYDRETTEMYANITDIVQLQYISSFEDHRCVVLLCCRWYNLFSRIAKPRADDYFKSINVKAAYQTNEPFILANQATQIFFLEDTFARSDDWRVLQRFEQRNSFNELHNKMMLTLLLMYKITQMFLISLRTITSMTPAKRLPVVLWTYKS